MTDERPSQELRQRVVDACHILYAAEQEHFHLGHVSAREPGSSVICVKPAGIGLREVTVDDLATMTLDGEKLDGPRPLHQEMPIHTEIYRRRLDVTCVVHTHPFYAAALSSTTVSVQMVSQDSVLFMDGVPRYESASLVVTREQGERLAATLGERRLVLLRNHGIAAAGTSVQEATFFAVSFDRSARMQLAAAQFGPLHPIDAAEAREMADSFNAALGSRVEVTWQYLLRAARR
jgi:L-fuculose-phosphate aldolase